MTRHGFMRKQRQPATAPYRAFPTSLRTARLVRANGLRPGVAAGASPAHSCCAFLSPSSSSRISATAISDLRTQSSSPLLIAVPRLARVRRQRVGSLISRKPHGHRSADMHKARAARPLDEAAAGHAQWASTFEARKDYLKEGEPRAWVIAYIVCCSPPASLPSQSQPTAKMLLPAIDHRVRARRRRRRRPRRA